MKSPLLAKVRKLHRWMALIVGVQLLLWTASGLYMTAVPLYMVHGKHLAQKASAKPLLKGRDFIATSELVSKHSLVPSVQLIMDETTPVYLVNSDGNSYYYNALTGLPLAAVTADRAEQVAISGYLGNGKVASVVAITRREQAPEIGGRATPIWQVNFDDWVNTSIYVSANLAKIETVRSDIWRIFDFVWMLHIMDYSERENFNNPLVIFMSSLGCLIALSGILLFVSGWQKSRRFLR